MLVAAQFSSKYPDEISYFFGPLRALRVDVILVWPL
jgi:hypothetical protein